MKNEVADRPMKLIAMDIFTAVRCVGVTFSVSQMRFTRSKIYIILAATIENDVCFAQILSLKNKRTCALQKNIVPFRFSDHLHTRRWCTSLFFIDANWTTSVY